MQAFLSLTADGYRSSSATGLFAMLWIGFAFSELSSAHIRVSYPAHGVAICWGHCRVGHRGDRVSVGMIAASGWIWGAAAPKNPRLLAGHRPFSARLRSWRPVPPSALAAAVSWAPASRWASGVRCTPRRRRWRLMQERVDPGVRIGRVFGLIASTLPADAISA